MGWVRGALACATACVLGCGSETHTVGQLEATPQVVRNAGAGRGVASSGSAGTNGAGPSAGEDIGTGGPALDGGGATTADPPFPSAFPEPPDAAVLNGDPNVSCMGGNELAARERLDLYLMVDRNITLSVPWTQIVQGIGEYLRMGEAAGTGVGIGYFPAEGADQQQRCDPDEYAIPAAPVDLLPANTSAVQATFPVPAFESLGGSPTKAALEGAIEYARSRWHSFGFTQAVVLITDSAQDFACFLEPVELQTVAGLGYTGSPSVRTYVIELTVPELATLLGVIGFRPIDLNEVALRGGTRQAHPVSLNLISGISSSLGDLLLDIQHDAEPCSYAVSPTARNDLEATVLGTAVGGSSPEALVRVASAAECGLGYYIDDIANPEWATLCPSTCAAVNANQRDVWWMTDCMR